MTDRITTQDLVNREVLACVSSLVSTLASGFGFNVIDRKQYIGSGLVELTEQAYELASPVLDYEEAARQAGYKVADGGPYICDPSGEFVSDDEGTIDPTMDDAWRMVCETRDLDPYEWEVYEHWIVSDWLADKLIEQGEKVDKDFSGLCVWARTTTGQAISMDAVIERIHATLLEG